MKTLELFELKNLIMDMAELGAANYAKMVSPVSDTLSQREAYHHFGESRVKRWVYEGLVYPKRSGTSKNSKKLYSRIDLIAAEKAINFGKIISQH